MKSWGAGRRRRAPALRQTRVCRQLGPVARELWRVKDYSLRALYSWNPRTKRYGCLSEEAKCMLRWAGLRITGMWIGAVNNYWLAEIMSEAIEAAEALGL